MRPCMIAHKLNAMCVKNYISHKSSATKTDASVTRENNKHLLSPSVCLFVYYKFTSFVYSAMTELDCIGRLRFFLNSTKIESPYLSESHSKFHPHVVPE